MFFRSLLILIQLLLGLLLLGCQATHYDDELIDDLEMANYSVTDLGSIPSPYFTTETRHIQVSGETIQIFEFSSLWSAWLASQYVSPDGYMINQQDISWLSTPHFYHAGRYIIIYTGDNFDLISIIENRFGEQFAGGVSYPDI